MISNATLTRPQITRKYRSSSSVPSTTYAAGQQRRGSGASVGRRGPGSTASSSTGAAGQQNPGSTTNDNKQRRASLNGNSPGLVRQDLTQINMTEWHAACDSFSKQNAYGSASSSSSASKPKSSPRRLPPASVVANLDDSARLRISMDMLGKAHYSCEDGTTVELEDLKQVLAACRFDRAYALLADGTLCKWLWDPLPTDATMRKEQQRELISASVTSHGSESRMQAGNGNTSTTSCETATQAQRKLAASNRRTSIFYDDLLRQLRIYEPATDCGMKYLSPDTRDDFTQARDGTAILVRKGGRKWIRLQISYQMVLEGCRSWGLYVVLQDGTMRRVVKPPLPSDFPHRRTTAAI